MGLGTGQGTQSRVTEGSEASHRGNSFFFFTRNCQLFSQNVCFVVRSHPQLPSSRYATASAHLEVSGRRSNQLAVHETATLIAFPEQALSSGLC